MAVIQTFPCQYVKLRAKLNDGRTLDWTHWVPNKSVDEALGTVGPDGEQYKSAEDFGDAQARGYLKNGIYAYWDGSEEESIPADKINELTFSVVTKNLTIAEIFAREAYMYDQGTDVRVRPARKGPDVQEMVSSLRSFFQGQTTLNDFFRVMRQPLTPHPAASSLLEPTANGYVLRSTRQIVDIQPLFSDQLLCGIVEVCRHQFLAGLSP